MVADSPDWSSSIVVTGTTVTFNMIFTGQSVAVFSGSQFGASLGNGVYVNANVAVGAAPAVVCTYLVPAGVTFWMQGFSYGINGAVNLVSCVGEILDNLAVILFFASKDGQTCILDTPIPFATGHTANLYIGEVTNPQVNAAAYGSFWGWKG